MPRPLRERLSPRAKAVPPAVQTWSSPALRESALPGANDCSDLLWARGFLLTSTEHDPPLPHWRGRALGRHCLSWDPRTTLAVATAGRSWVAFLGRAVDLATWECEPEAIAASLLRARLDGRTAMLERLDDLSGRYALFDGDAGAAFVQSDAAGMRAIFYREGEAPVAASHAGLVAERTGAGPSAFPDPEALRREQGAYALPGRATTFASVTALTPNTELDLDSGRPRRCFPRGRQERRGVGPIVEEVLPLLQGQLAVMLKHERFEVSLTAGLDSRTTLALTAPFADRLEYFTYETPGTAGPSRRAVEFDVRTAETLAERLGVRHRRIEVGGRTPDEPLRSIMERNSPRRSHPGLAAAHRRLDGERGVHLRSNLYEIGRAYYRAKRDRPRSFGPGQMAALLTGHKSDDPALREAFDDYMRATGFGRAQRRYDPADLFYWEHRSGMWLNAHLTESDIAFDTFILVNSRRVYRLLLSAPLRDRINGTVFLELIRRAWPEVLDVPVNGEPLS